jgi:predicted MFS family arabinose efflux permease
MNQSSALVALRYRDFRLLWAGQSVSSLGTQIQTVALAWLVYSLTGSAAQLGAVGLARAIPTMALSLFGGTLADRRDRRKLLIISQAILAVLSALLAIAVSAGITSIILIDAFAALTAAASAIESPTSQAFIPSLVPREILVKALTLDVLASDTVAVVGPAIGGVVIAVLGVSAAFWLDAVSFFAVVAALVVIRTRVAPPKVEGHPMVALLKGITFVRERGILWQLMLLDFLATFLISPTGLLPVFARDVLVLGPAGLGLLYAAPSAGAVVGAGVMTFMRSPRFPGRMVAISIAGYALALGFFGFSTWLIPSLILLGLGGGLDAISMTMRHTVQQLATPDELRGRVGALHDVFASGGPRLGDFQAGLMASVIGAPGAMIAGGLACLGVVATARLWAPQLWSYRGEDLPVHLVPEPVRVADDD